MYGWSRSLAYVSKTLHRSSYLGQWAMQGQLYCFHPCFHFGYLYIINLLCIIFITSTKKREEKRHVLLLLKTYSRTMTPFGACCQEELKEQCSELLVPVQATAGGNLSAWAAAHPERQCTLWNTKWKHGDWPDEYTSLNSISVKTELAHRLQQIN